MVLCLVASLNAATIVHTAQSLLFLFLATQVIHQKPKKTLKEITNELCPVSETCPLVFQKKFGWLVIFCDLLVSFFFLHLLGSFHYIPIV